MRDVHREQTDERQLIPGMDWRDTIPNYKGKFLLANQMLLADMYELLENSKAANLVKENVNKLFLSKNQYYYADTVYWEDGELKQDHNFDSFGNALAIINGTASEKVSNGILNGFNIAKTPFGYRNITPPYEFNRAKLMATWYFMCRVGNGAFLRNKFGMYQNSAIWPFVEIRVIDALRKMQATAEAEAATKLLIERRASTSSTTQQMERQEEVRGSFGQPLPFFRQLNCVFRQQKA